LNAQGLSPYDATARMVAWAGASRTSRILDRRCPLASQYIWSRKMVDRSTRKEMSGAAGFSEVVAMETLRSLRSPS
jgi:hypothetical protein